MARKYKNKSKYHTNGRAIQERTKNVTNGREIQVKG
jgi:hypothetical protein